MTESVSDIVQAEPGTKAPVITPLDYLQPGMVVVDLSVASRKRLFEALAELIATNTSINSEEEDSSTPDMEQIFTTLHDRERLGCTGLGKGVALPHGRIDGLFEPVIAIARLEHPIDYDAADGVPVWLVACLLVPAEANEAHLNALAALASRFNDQNFLEQAKAATSAVELYDLFSLN
jgi:PTS system nitrogen regulatory IIA component